MKLATIILPKFNNNGENVQRDHMPILSDVLTKFGGYTESDCKGAWRDPKSGKLYVDYSTRIEIAFDKTLEAEENLHKVAAMAARVLDQECIFLTIDGDVHFVEPVRIGEAA